MTTWPAVLGPLCKRQPVDVDSMRWAMSEIMSGAATPTQMGGFLLALRTRGETPGDIEALADVMLSFANPLPIQGNALDIVGTGGDLAHTVNISTMAAVVMATNGARIVKHGNRAASSKCGTADVLEALGLQITLPPEQTLEVFNEIAMTFVFAPTFHPAMRFAGPSRRELGVPTIFNFLGPLTNPARPAASLIGVADATMAPLMAEVLCSRGMHAIVARGDDGLDEVSIAAPSRLWTTWGGEVRSLSLDPQALGIPAPRPEALRGGDAQFNASIFRRIVAGESDEQLAPMIDAVALNAAVADVAWRSAEGETIADPVTEIAAGLHRMREIIASGAAARTLDTWIGATHRP